VSAEPPVVRGGLEPFELPVGELLLRPWRADDADDVWAAMQDPALRRWNDTGSGSRDSVVAVLARRADWSAGDHASFAVVAGTTLVGSISLHAIDRVQGDAEIGYWTDAAVRGRGIAVRAADALCRWAFRALQLDRVQLFHAVENVASGRVAAKAGFTLEGRLRRSHRYGDGERHDELLWSRLSDDPPPAPR
jgi:RimJ/RimL family protein N-acetyltransferase